MGVGGRWGYVGVMRQGQSRQGDVYKQIQVIRDKEIKYKRDTSKQPIRTRYLGHVTGYYPIRDHNLSLSVSLSLCLGFFLSLSPPSLTFSNGHGNEITTKRVCRVLQLSVEWIGYWLCIQNAKCKAKTKDEQE
eukprot:sb/3474844/